MNLKRTASSASCWACLLFTTAVEASKPPQRSFLMSRSTGSEEGSSGDMRILKTGGSGIDNCLTLYEWSNCDEEIGGYQYTGQTRPAEGTSYSGTIRSFNTPLFTNEELEGDPVARLRGSYIYDPTDSFATFTSAFQFVGAEQDKLAFHMGFSFRNEFEQYGVPVGGSGRWTGFQGKVTGKQITSADSSPAIVRYTICPPSSQSSS